MVTQDFASFLAASAGAAAALIGLLFIAVSIAPERNIGPDAPPERQALAESAFTALANAFFLSLGGLIPGINLGAMALVVGLVALRQTVSMALRTMRKHSRGQQLGHLLSVFASLVIYGGQCLFGIQLLQQPHNTNALLNLTYLLLAIYSIGLGRAWQLLGASRHGALGWLSPLLGRADQRTRHMEADSSDERHAQVTRPPR